jgi:hypothetical protein
LERRPTSNGVAVSELQLRASDSCASLFQPYGAIGATGESSSKGGFPTPAYPPPADEAKNIAPELLPRLQSTSATLVNK